MAAHRDIGADNTGHPREGSEVRDSMRSPVPNATPRTPPFPTVRIAGGQGFSVGSSTMGDLELQLGQRDTQAVVSAVSEPEMLWVGPEQVETVRLGEGTGASVSRTD